MSTRVPLSVPWVVPMGQTAGRTLGRTPDGTRDNQRDGRRTRRGTDAGRNASVTLFPYPTRTRPDPYYLSKESAHGHPNSPSRTNAAAARIKDSLAHENPCRTPAVGQDQPKPAPQPQTARANRRHTPMAHPAYGHHWRQLRTYWANTIHTAHTLGEPITCPRCHQPITPNQQWDLGHAIDKANGGTHHDARPEHASCNRSAGAYARNTRPKQRTW